MTLAFPLSLAQFLDGLPIRDFSCAPVGGVETDRTRGGQQISGALGAPLWRGSVAMGDLTADEAAFVRAGLGVLGQAGASFIARDIRLPGPALDPDGSVLGAAAPVLAGQAASSGADLRIGGLPAGYQLKAGDRLGFLNGGVRRYHELAEDALADGTGLTPLVAVLPVLAEGWTDGTSVTLIAPTFLAEIDHGSQTPVAKTGGTLWRGGDFSFTQTLKAG